MAMRIARLVVVRRASLRILGTDGLTSPVCAFGLFVLVCRCVLLGLSRVGFGTNLTVQLHIIRLGFLLLTFGERSLLISLESLRARAWRLGLPQTLSVKSASTVKVSWDAVSTRVSEVFSIRLLGVVRIVTFNMLPCIAGFAVYGIPVIVREATDTLDGIGLFVDRFDLTRHIMR